MSLSVLKHLEYLRVEGHGDEMVMLERTLNNERRWPLLRRCTVLNGRRRRSTSGLLAQKTPKAKNNTHRNYKRSFNSDANNTQQQPQNKKVQKEGKTRDAFFRERAFGSRTCVGGQPDARALVLGVLAR